MCITIHSPLKLTFSVIHYSQLSNTLGTYVDYQVLYSLTVLGPGLSITYLPISILSYQKGIYFLTYTQLEQDHE